MSWSDKFPGCIIVIGVDNMTFPVHPVTLDALACSCYDPYWHLLPPNVAKMTSDAWHAARNEMWDKAHGR